MKVLIVGLGSIATKHIYAIREIDGESEIYALRRSINADDKEGIINLYSFDDAKKIVFDFAIVSNPTSKHKETIDMLLMLKCPLFIEKPVNDSIDLQDTIAEIEQNNVLTYIACNLRFLDALQYVKNELQSSKKCINEVNVYCGSYLPDWRPGVDFRTTYSAQRNLGGGVNIDLIHEIDYMYWLFGQPLTISKILKSNSSLRIDAIDYANYCFEYSDFCASAVLNYYRKDYKRTLEIVFDDCTWLVDLQHNTITSEGREIFCSYQRIGDTYLAQMKYFYQLLQSNAKRSFNTIQEAVEVLKMSL